MAMKKELPYGEYVARMRGILANFKDATGVKLGREFAKYFTAHSLCQVGTSFGSLGTASA